MKLEYNNTISYDKKDIKVQTQLKEYEPAEIVDVIYDDSHPRYSTDMDIGSVIIRRLFTDYNKKYTALPIAKPANGNNQLYPLRYEIVMVYKSIGPHTGTTNQSTTYYYDNPISVWNLANHNALPFSTISTNREKQNDYTNFTGVNSKKNQNIILGEYFTEQPSVNKLKPFEGDYILQGRYNNSIRFTNTTLPNKDNQWSKQGKAGDPLIIINNTRNTEKSFGFRLEDINRDDSNIWLTSTQTIPIELVAKEQKGFVANYKPELVNKYNQPQLIFNSGRLIFNAKTDSVVVSANKSINLISNDNIVINSDKYINLNSNKIYIGGVSASKEKEPIVLGQQILNTLDEIINIITTLTVGTAVGPSTPPLPTTLTKLLNLQIKLKTSKYILSKKIFTE